MKKYIFFLCFVAVVAVLIFSCSVNKNPVGPDINTYCASYAGYVIGKSYRIENFEPAPAGGPTNVLWKLKLGIPLFSYPSDNCLTRIYANYPYVKDGVTNHAYGIWYKLDGWADQYYWWTVDFTFMSGINDLTKYGNAIRFKIKALKFPGAIAGRIRFLLTSPEAASVADITANRENTEQQQEQEQEVLRISMLPVSWEWKTIIIPFSSDDVRATKCSGFEVSINLDAKGQGGFILIDDIEIIEYYEKN